MIDENKDLSDEQLRLLIDSMCGQMSDNGQDAVQVANTLIGETIKFRNKLKEETGEKLTVGDTRIALEALSRQLEGEKSPSDLSPEQKALVQIWVDRLTLFRSE